MKWNDLTMKERSDLMSLFLKHGIGSLSDMRRIYDGEHEETQQMSRPPTRSRREQRIFDRVTAVIERQNPYNYVETPNGTVKIRKGEKPLEDLSATIGAFTAAGDAMDIYDFTQAIKNKDIGNIIKQGIFFLPFVSGAAVNRIVGRDAAQMLKYHGKNSALDDNITRGDIYDARQFWNVSESQISDEEIARVLSKRKRLVEDIKLSLGEEVSPHIKDIVLSKNKGLRTPDFEGGESMVYDLGDKVLKVSRNIGEDINTAAKRTLSKNYLGEYGEPLEYLGFLNHDKGRSLVYTQSKVSSYGFDGTDEALKELKKIGWQFEGPFDDIYMSPNGFIVNDIGGNNIGINNKGKTVVFDPLSVSYKYAPANFGKSMLFDGESIIPDFNNLSPLKKYGGKLKKKAKRFGN